jgi:hypothetical protein
MGEEFGRFFKGFVVGFLLPVGAALVILDCKPPTLTLLDPEVIVEGLKSLGMGSSGAVCVREMPATLCLGDFKAPSG